MDKSHILLLSAAALSAASGQLLFKIGAQGRESLLQFINAPIFLGLILYASSTIIWIYALAFLKLVNVYAFTALTFVLVYAGGVILLGEQLTRLAAVGVLLVLTGLYLITTYNA